MNYTQSQLELLDIYATSTKNEDLFRIVNNYRNDSSTSDYNDSILANSLSEITDYNLKHCNIICRKIGLNSNQCLTCDNKKFIKSLIKLFTYLNNNSNIVLTNYIDKEINLTSVQQVITNYLLTSDTSQLPTLRLSVANFIKKHKKCLIFGNGGE